MGGMRSLSLVNKFGLYIQPRNIYKYKPCFTGIRKMQSNEGKIPKTGFQTTVQAMPVMTATSTRELEAINKWVVFSDLHVSEKTVATCIEVLRRVKSEAINKNAGILFLGDFWHHREILQVKTLNMILKEIETWDIPTIMLTGNHDQSDAEGLEHSLSVLSAVCENIRVVDEPAFFLNALWLPYRKNYESIENTLEAVLKEREKEIKAIFAHLDIVGGKMNEKFLSTVGVDPKRLPKGLPIYTGHYHLPQRIADTNIHYIGSQYQINRSESGQEKRILILNKDYNIEESLPIDFGQRFFEMDGSEFDNVDHLRRGDSIRWIASKEKIENFGEGNLRDFEERMKNKGVTIEVVIQPEAKEFRIKNAEDLNANELFSLYATNKEFDEDTLSYGLEVLREVGSVSTQAKSVCGYVNLSEVCIKGFGSYFNETKFVLDKKGVRVLCGKNLDEVNAESNGAGKSMLVMAVLWAITGRIQVRGEVVGRGPVNADIIHDDLKSATVTLYGTKDAEEFSITRTVQRKGRTVLKFMKNGQDLTKADNRHTQAVIDDALGTDVLCRTVFLTHSNISYLLGINDRDLKTELAKVVDLEIWKRAKEFSSGRQKKEKSTMDSMRNTCNLLKKTRDKSLVELERKKSKKDEWEQKRTKSLADYKDRISELQRAIPEKISEAFDVKRTLILMIDVYKQKIEDLNNFIKSRESMIATEVYNSKNPEIEQVIVPDIKKLEEEMIGEREAQRGREEMLQERKIEIARLKAFYETKVKQYEDYKSLNGGEISKRNLTCPKCYQQIDFKNFEDHLCQYKRGVEEAENELEKVRDREKMISSEINNKKRSLDEMLRKMDSIMAKKRRIEKEVEEEQKRKNKEIEKSIREAVIKKENEKEIIYKLKSALERLEEAIGKCSKFKYDKNCSNLTQELDIKDIENLISFSRNIVRDLESLIQNLEMRKKDILLEKEKVNPFEDSEKQIVKEIEKNEKQIKKSEDEILRSEKDFGIYLNLCSAFDGSGIPSFVLDGALNELSIKCSKFLRYLAPEMTLRLTAISKDKDSECGPEKVAKEVVVRSSDGFLRNRTLEQLSSGEFRKLALALAFAFSEFTSKRGRLICNLLVLDEVMGQLDREGCNAFHQILEQLNDKSIILIGQKGSFITQSFDNIQWVVKKGGKSYLENGN